MLAAALLVAPFAASADGLKYSYVEVGYANLDLDIEGEELKFDGLQARGSASITPNVYLFGSYGKVRNDDFGADIDVDEIQVGAGYHHSITPRTDVIAELAYLSQEASALGYSEDATGARLSGGFRGSMTDSLEGLIKASYTDGNDFDGEFSVTAGLNVRIYKSWSFTGEVEAGEDVTKYLLGVRASF